MTAAQGPSDAVDLGGCGGCSLGCAVSCADGREDRATDARQTLVASGVGILFLAVVPGLVVGALIVQALAFVAAWCGATTAALAALAVRRGRPEGDRPARLAYRVLPAGVAAMTAAWLAAVADFVIG
ncbi:MAG: hypothetical protein KG028_12245 [Actinobacteria bacterium]|nr:hypothetical protein [Actinomycetota bacterium]